MFVYRCDSLGIPVAHRTAVGVLFFLFSGSVMCVQGLTTAGVEALNEGASLYLPAASSVVCSTQSDVVGGFKGSETQPHVNQVYVVA